MIDYRLIDLIIDIVYVFPPCLVILFLIVSTLFSLIPFARCVPHSHIPSPSSIILLNAICCFQRVPESRHRRAPTLRNSPTFFVLYTQLAVVLLNMRIRSSDGICIVTTKNKVYHLCLPLLCGLSSSIMSSGEDLSSCCL